MLCSFTLCFRKYYFLYLIIIISSCFITLSWDLRTMPLSIVRFLISIVWFWLRNKIRWRRNHKKARWMIAADYLIVLHYQRDELAFHNVHDFPLIHGGINQSVWLGIELVDHKKIETKWDQVERTSEDFIPAPNFQREKNMINSLNLVISLDYYKWLLSLLLKARWCVKHRINNSVRYSSAWNWLEWVSSPEDSHTYYIRYDYKFAPTDIHFGIWPGLPCPALLPDV